MARIMPRRQRAWTSTPSTLLSTLPSASMQPTSAAIPTRLRIRSIQERVERVLGGRTCGGCGSCVLENLAGFSFRKCSPIYFHRSVSLIYFDSFLFIVHLVCLFSSAGLFFVFFWTVPQSRARKEKQEKRRKESKIKDIRLHVPETISAL